jgi:dTDP-4-amino-4,6-dideoxygalactose transaminase
VKNSRPVILGGNSPAVTLDQTQANKWPITDVEDEAAVCRVLRDGNLTTHVVSRELEADYAALAEVPYARSHNNATAALMAAFFALDLVPGDEILVPSATFWASVLPMQWFGLVPVFCESEPERMGIDPNDAERRITSRTRAIVVVHLWGLPSKMTEIYDLAKRHNLRIVEDASHAHGAKWRGRPCGGLGDIGVFSLQGDKLAPGGEGGVFLCRDYQLYERATLLGDITRIVELETPARRFYATSFGVKTRIAPMSAAVARVQLRRLPANNARRNANITYLSDALESMGFRTFRAPPHVDRVYFEFLVHHDSLPLPLDHLERALQAEGCLVGAPRYPLLHQQPYFTEGHYARMARLPPDVPVPQYDPDALPFTRAFNATLLHLPAFPNAERNLLDQYVNAFEKVLEHAREIRNELDRASG